MEKKSMKLSEFFQLEAELNGVRNPNTGEVSFNGLLSQKMPLKTKYWLSDLAKKVSEQTEACNKLREELIKKYGTEKDGQVSISVQVEEDGKSVLNPSFQKFQEEYNTLLAEEREVEYKPLSIEDLGDIETEEVYQIVFSLIKT
jgi:hypothetical protein